MKKITYVTFFITLFFFDSLVLAHSLEDAEAELQERERYAQFVDQHAPSFSLTDAEGNVTSSDDLKNKVVVLNFIYTRCKEDCPLHMNLLAQVQEKANEAGLRDEVEFITIATDNENITGTRNNMRAYGKNFDLDPTNWRFLYRDENQPAETTLQVAEEYGLSFVDVAEGVQMHGIVTHVLDQSGRMRARFHGLQFDTEHLVSYLEVLVKGPDALPNSLWDRLRHRFNNVAG